VSGRGTCTACHHAQRVELDQQLVQGTPDTQVAARFGLGKDAVRRHRINHLSASLKALRGRGPGATGERAMDRLEGLYAAAMAVLESGMTEGKATMTLAAVKELRALVELLAKLTGELDERPTVQVLNVATSPEWLEVRGRMLGALRPYPEAARAVVAALEPGGVHE